MVTEILCAIILLAVPGILCFFHAGFQIYFDYPMSAIFILITSTHFIIASIAMTFTIKSYRQYVFELFSWKCKIKAFNQKQKCFVVF